MAHMMAHRAGPVLWRVPRGPTVTNVSTTTHHTDRDQNLHQAAEVARHSRGSGGPPADLSVLPSLLAAYYRHAPTADPPDRSDLDLSRPFPPHHHPPPTPPAGPPPPPPPTPP